MEELRVRPMTAAEFDAFRERLVRSYAADQVRAGNWTAGQAEELAASQTDGLLPDGLGTQGTLLLTAETPAASRSDTGGRRCDAPMPPTVPGSSTSRSRRSSAARGTGEPC